MRLRELKLSAALGASRGAGSESGVDISKADTETGHGFIPSLPHSGGQRSPVEVRGPTWRAVEQADSARTPGAKVRGGEAGTNRMFSMRYQPTVNSGRVRPA